MTRRARGKRVRWLVIGALGILACCLWIGLPLGREGRGTSGPTSTPRPSATFRPTRTPAPTRTATATWTASPTRTARPTSTTAPTVTPSPTLSYGPPAGVATVAPDVWRCPSSLQGALLVGSAESDKFHWPSCISAQQIEAANRLCFTDRKAALAYGYTPCGRCNP